MSTVCEGRWFIIVPIRQTRKIDLFDKYIISIESKLKWHSDGTEGQRSLFLADRGENFVITFEEGMECLDMKTCSSEQMSYVEYEHMTDGKYIHLIRDAESNDRKGANTSFFHIELVDSQGEKVFLPGQITVAKGYDWTCGVEPVLLEILTGITLRENA